MIRRTPVTLVAAVVAVALLASACGSEKFEAQEFVDEANANGAELALGAQLETLREGQELHEVEFAHAEGSNGHAHGGGGTLVVTEDDDDALSEYERCSQSATLVCYRAANVAIYFEGALAPEDRDAFEAALRSMAEG